MRNRWGAPDGGWPDFDKNGARIKPTDGIDECGQPEYEVLENGTPIEICRKTGTVKCGNLRAYRCGTECRS